MSDWLPRRREAQLSIAQRWIIELPRSNGAWTVTEAEVSELAEIVEDAQNAILRQSENSGPVETARVRVAFAALVRYMRMLHRRKFFSPPMEDSDYTRLGLRPPDRTRTEHTVVTELAEFEIRLRGIRQLEVNFWIKGAAHKAKPAAYDGAVLVWDILDAPPERPAALTHNTMATRTPHVIEFDETERGRTAYIALCWQNERGIRGPWSEVLSAVVP